MTQALYAHMNNKRKKKEMLSSLPIKEIQIKTILNSSSLLLEWLLSKTQTTNDGEDVGKKKLHTLLVGM
jgi:hypothetical protein